MSLNLAHLPASAELALGMHVAIVLVLIAASLRSYLQCLSSVKVFLPAMLRLLGVQTALVPAQFCCTSSDLTAALLTVDRDARRRT